MINHHPKFELLDLYTKGHLPASLSAGVNIHLEHCSKCRNTVEQLTEQLAEIYFEQESNDVNQNTNPELTDSYQLMLDKIFASADDEEIIEKPKSVDKNNVTFDVKGKQYALPKVLQNMELTSQINLGKLTRSRVTLDEGEVHTSLLHIEPGGSVPQHTHKGYELTVLIDGTFSDEKGTYHPGDFIMLDGNHTHQPVSEQGCLCYTVANDALHFTQGINKLLNPIGSFIY